MSIFLQDVSGIHIFTGSTAVKWFMKNMEGVISVQVARVCVCCCQHFASASSTLVSANVHTVVPKSDAITTVSECWSEAHGPQCLHRDTRLA